MIRPPSYWLRLGDATSQWINVALFNGNANESISGRSWRSMWVWAEVMIDRVLGERHCEESYLWDIARAIHLTESVPASDLAKARARMK